MKASTIAKIERKFRPAIVNLFQPRKVVEIYSKKRKDFLEKLFKEGETLERYSPPKELKKFLWGLEFQSPIINAAGMFKNGEGYDLVFNQGAGGYLGGTGTWNSRNGNEKDGINLPFAPYPKSHAASNFLGLPNEGDIENSTKARNIVRKSKIPVGWSVMSSPDLQGEQKLERLVQSIVMYYTEGVDFIELNESCPNTSHAKPQDSDLYNRLKYIKNKLNEKIMVRKLPVIVKFSNDTKLEQVKQLLDMLFYLGYDGVNFGNTSTNYAEKREMIHPDERALYDFFTISKEFGVGGGISGRPLKESSLELCAKAVEYLRAGRPKQEFHVGRTGGIETTNDLIESTQAGVSLNQWFTGYFDQLGLHGHDVYKNLYANYLNKSAALSESLLS